MPPFRLAAAVTLMAAALSLATPAPAGATAGTATRRAAEIPPRKVANVAHRGASSYAPENTMAAFRLAQTQGADMFEADVQQTKDLELILMHDTTLARTTNAEEIFPDRAPWQISEFTLAEIRRLDAGSWFEQRFQGEPVPTLAETLRAMRGGRVGMLLEIKAPELYPGIEDRIAERLHREPYWLRTSRWDRRLIVQSFNWRSMRWFRTLLPWVPIGVLGTPAVEQLPRLAQFADQINPYYRDLSEDYVARIHALNMEVFTWSAQDAETMRQAIAQHVDGLITSRPDLLRDLLAQRIGGMAARAGPPPTRSEPARPVATSAP
ncbi:MAG: glycerophosphodiester phosphodiesterase [Streptosporangiaceae bacterium]|nr:glycerophosphodiester phosphodiesterase [Streptosporangiaceae bacterium]